MVKALYGTCNGADVVFSRDEQGRWMTAVPAAENQTYIIEVWAEDEAGNVSYFATVEATYNSSSLTMEFGVIEIGEQFTVNEVLSVFRGSAMKTNWRTHDLCGRKNDSTTEKSGK